MRSVRHLVLSLFAIALVCAVGPLVMQRLGFQFQPLGMGGAGDNFAGYRLSTHLLRLDLILAFSGSLGLGLYLAMRGHRRSRTTALMAITLALSAVVASVQFIEVPSGGLPDYLLRLRAFETSQLAHTLAGAVILAGCLALRLRGRLPGRHPHLLVITTGVAALAAGVLLLPYHEPAAAMVDAVHWLLLATYAAAALLLQRELRRERAPIYVAGVLAGLVPLAVNQVLFLLPGFSLDAAAFNRAAVLQWCAYLIPLLGLSIDLARDASDHVRERERAYLRRVIDALPDPVYARDTDGRYRLLNNAAAAFLGGTREQFEGKLVTEVGLDEGFVARNLEIDREVLTTGLQRLHPPALVTDARGGKFWLQMLTQPLASEDDRADQVLGVATDVSQLKEAETALAARLRGEKTLRRCLARLVRSPAEDFQAAMQDVLRTVGEFCDADSVFIYEIQWPARLACRREIWNRGHDTPTRPSYDLRRLRWALGDLASGETVVVADPEHLPADPRDREDALALGARFLALAPVLSREGKLWGIIGAHCPEPPEPDGNGLRRVLAGLADLYIGALGRIEAEAHLQQAKDTAEASASAKGEFLANMSHEIRTPLNAVIGLADILRGLGPTPEQAHYVEMIHQAGDALLGLINDILDFSKIEAGQLQLDPLEVDLPSLLAEVVDMMAYHAQQQGLELVYHLAANARVRAVVDPVRLKQVLLNLLNNAIKFTEEGHVALRVSIDNEGRCRFVVADTGIGIPADKLAHVFDKFTQADASHTRKYGGTGLGLAICHSLVSLMGGVIEVASKPGRGTLFSVTVPLEHRPAEPLAPLPEPELEGRRHLSIMLDLAARESLAGYLADLGVAGMSLGDPLAAIAELPYAEHDFLLVDGQLDSLLLQTVHKAVVELPVDRRPHMVLVTPLGDEREPAELMAEGWAAVLHKPVRRPTLRRALHAALNPRTVFLGDLEDEAPVLDFGAHVLLVEDNLFNQKVATRLLETLGCRVTLAENGQRAVDAAATERFDLVLMDCQMPVMDGLEATRRIRELDGELGRVPVVAMTANVLGEHRQECLDAGMDDFASKPVNKKTLREIVARWTSDEEAASRREPVEV